MRASKPLWDCNPIARKGFVSRLLFRTRETRPVSSLLHMESGSSKAVFISYAREDTAAAQRIAEALRSHGVEVWFDQNELRGGDAWDAKIRKQIDACTLIIPIISRHTEDRSKGYFRLEWKLAVEQTR